VRLGSGPFTRASGGNGADYLQGRLPRSRPEDLRQHQCVLLHARKGFPRHKRAIKVRCLPITSLIRRSPGNGRVLMLQRPISATLKTDRRRSWFVFPQPSCRFGRVGRRPELRPVSSSGNSPYARAAPSPGRYRRAQTAQGALIQRVDALLAGRS
jgi:hypothetical protein